MCLSQMHAGERQCIVNTFFLSAFSLEHICSSHSSFFFQIHVQVFFSLPPFRLSHLSTRYLRGSWSMLIIKSTKDFCTTTQLGISKASITLGKKNKTAPPVSYLEPAPASTDTITVSETSIQTSENTTAGRQSRGRMLLGVEHVSFRRRLLRQQVAGFYLSRHMYHFKPHSEETHEILLGEDLCIFPCSSVMLHYIPCLHLKHFVCLTTTY